MVWFLDVETFAGVLQERAAEINPKKINIEAKIQIILQIEFFQIH